MENLCYGSEREPDRPEILAPDVISTLLSLGILDWQGAGATTPGEPLALAPRPFHDRIHTRLGC